MNKYFCDNKRHLVCVPYSIRNLHKMAKDLKIGRQWFHKNHYDMPKKRIEEITKKCTLINSRQIVIIIKMELDLTKIKDVEVEGIDTRDYPDFVDAFISSATYEGREMTEEELDHLNENYSDFVYDKVWEHFTG